MVAKIDHEPGAVFPSYTSRSSPTALEDRDQAARGEREQGIGDLGRLAGQPGLQELDREDEPGAQRRGREQLEAAARQQPYERAVVETAQEHVGQGGRAVLRQRLGERQEREAVLRELEIEGRQALDR